MLSDKKARPFMILRKDITKGENAQTYVLKVLGKGNKIRRIPIKKSALDHYLHYFSANAQGEFLSSTRSGVPMSRGNLYDEVSKLLRKYRGSLISKIII